MSIENSIETSINKLLVVMKQLRDPKTGCEWDKKQDFQSISPFTIEEAYEVVDSIEREDYESLKAELGDLLLQVVFHSEIASELGLFKFEDVVNSISEKLINRHPYVFTEQRKHTQEEQLDNWEEIILKEKEKKNLNSIMDDLPRNLPALSLALSVSTKGACHNRASAYDIDFNKKVIIDRNLLNGYDYHFLKYFGPNRVSSIFPITTEFIKNIFLNDTKIIWVHGIKIWYNLIIIVLS